MDAAQAEFDRAQRDWDRAQTLYKNDDISTAQFDQYRSRWKAPTAALKQAKEREALVLAGSARGRGGAAPARWWTGRAAALKMAEANAARTQAARAGTDDAAGRDRARRKRRWR